MSRATTLENRDLSQWEPTWEAGEVIPHQGNWTEEEYLSLTTNHLVEYSDGFLDIPPVPTMSHQLMISYLYCLLHGFVSGRDLGTLLLMGLRVRLWPRKICEPDVVFMAKDHADRMGEDCWEGADLTMEVVSGSSKDRRRDLVVKRKDYARAGIAEYWIVDPRDELITVLRLRGKEYIVHGAFGKGTTATSHLLKGFEVDVTKAFAQQARPTAPKAARNGKRKPKE